MRIFDIIIKIGYDVIDFDGEGGLMFYNVIFDMINRDGVGVIVLSYNSENRIIEDNCKFFGCY